MINEVLESLKTQIEAVPLNPTVEVFLRDISQYKYISQNPVAVINFRGLELEKPPHPSIVGKKGILDLSFFHFLRTVSDDSNADRLMRFFESLNAIECLDIQTCRPYSHKKNTLIWEVRAQVTKVFQ